MSTSLLSLFCFLLTLLFYYASKFLYRRKRSLLLMPLLLAPLLLVIVVMMFHIPYQAYMADAHWLLWLLGPATVAFAVPVYDNRALLRQHWLSLSVGVWYRCWWLFQVRCCWRVGSTFLTCCNAALLCVLLPLLLR